MSSLLALASSALFGVADFLGGLATRRTAVFRVVLWSQLVGLVVGLGSAWMVESRVRPVDLVLGGVAGLAGSVGLMALYAGLAGGRMAVVAPTSAVFATAIPVVVGLVAGERFAGTVWLGVVIAIPAVFLVGAGDTVRGSGFGLGVLAGAGFAAFFVVLSLTSEGAGLWPLVPARLTSLALVAAVSTVRGSGLTPPEPGSRLVTAAAGAGDMAANLAFLLAVQRGPLTSTVVLASLYPAFTVLLARTILSEAIRRTQWSGIVLAVVAVALIAG